MSATAKFYLGFTLALLVVIGVSFFAGYETGAHRPARAALRAP